MESKKMKSESVVPGEQKKTEFALGKTNIILIAVAFVVIVVGFLLMLVGAVATLWSFYVQAVPGVVHSTPVIMVVWAFCTLNCVALTAGTFLLFSCISIPQPPRFIAEMSRLSYGMFLMHIFWLGLWVSVFKSTLGLPTVAAIPVIAVCTFICCVVASKLISLIPGSKWIIG